MSVKRRDNKNRVLRNGESQRKDGRYAYVYVDASGKQRFLYSWKLEDTDRLPKGKRDCVSLRSKIKALQKDLDDGIKPDGGGMTVLELVEKYVSQKTGVRLATKSGYDYVIKQLTNGTFGSKRIDKIKLSDAKGWFITLQANGKSYGTICNIRGVLMPAFQMAVDDDLIRKNPFDFSISTVLVNDSTTRKAISEEEEKMFLEFVKNNAWFRKHYDAIYILFNTGLRISELAGLTELDVDFKNRKIRVDHQLLKRKKDGYTKLVIESTKTASGVRYVPMTEEVSECFRRIVKNRKKPPVEPIVDGMQGFLFLSRNGVPLDATRWDEYFKMICRKYNDTNSAQITNVTPHVCRHTFCTKMARRGMNPKTLQYIMGHSNISITLNVYTHVEYRDAQKEMNRIYVV